MGATQAREMADTLPLEQALEWHLRANHYPAIPTSMVEPCKQAIAAANIGNWDDEIELPPQVSYRGSKTAPAWAIVQQHHLEAWLVADTNE